MIARILLIDDNVEIRAMLNEFLTQNLHMQVLEASDGAQGFAMADKESPHLIITDVVMPGLYGTTATKRLQEYPKTKHIPIIVVSGSMEASMLTELLKSPKVRFLKKPVDLALLEKTMRQLLPNGGFRPWGG